MEKLFLNTPKLKATEPRIQVQERVRLVTSFQLWASAMAITTEETVKITTKTQSSPKAQTTQILTKILTKTIYKILHKTRRRPTKM